MSAPTACTVGLVARKWEDPLRGDLDAFHREGGWFNHIEGEPDTFSGPHDTRDEAVDTAACEYAPLAPMRS